MLQKISLELLEKTETCISLHLENRAYQPDKKISPIQLRTLQTTHQQYIILYVSVKIIHRNEIHQEVRSITGIGFQSAY